MAVFFKCSGCGKEEEAVQTWIYSTPAYVSPTGWFHSKLSNHPVIHAHDASCIAKAELKIKEEVRPYVEWVQVIRRREKPKTTPEDCKWCGRLGKTCPAHLRQQAAEERKKLDREALDG